MPSNDERRKGLRACLPAEFFFNILDSPESYTHGIASLANRLAAIDAIKVPPPKTEAQVLLSRIDQKLSLIVGMMADRNSRKSYLYEAIVQDISEFGLSFGHSIAIEHGAIIELGLKLNSDAALMDIAAKVVHVKPPSEPDCGHANIYGVEFTDIQSKDQNEIVQWIFTHQREQIRRRRERI
ncbi:MAG: PilZ domain-containing protein [Candidatus Adiutrix sp.]